VVIAFPTATPTPSPSVAAGTPTPTATPLPNGPPLAVPLLCTYAWESGQAKIDCSTSFSEDYTEITWTATNATPALVTTFAKTFTTYRASAGTTTVQAKVCYGAVCTNSAPVDVIVGAAAVMSPTLMLAKFHEGSDVCAEYTQVEFTVTATNWQPNLPEITGTMALFDNGQPIGTAAWDGATAYLYNITFPDPGGHSITASYSGDGSWASATAGPLVFTATVCG
jgi:hypothetical protein